MELLYFILGFISAVYLIPLFDGIQGWFLSWIEARKTKHSEIITQSNIKMRQAAAALDETPKNLIGFGIPDATDYDEEEGDEDEI